MTVGLIPGSFDPFHNGHLEVVERAAQIFDEIVVAAIRNPQKSEALFALEQIPAEAANKTPLASWWIGHAGLWFSMVAAFWTVALVALAGLRLNRWEE